MLIIGNLNNEKLNFNYVVSWWYFGTFKTKFEFN